MSATQPSVRNTSSNGRRGSNASKKSRTGGSNTWYSDTIFSNDGPKSATLPQITRAAKRRVKSGNH